MRRVMYLTGTRADFGLMRFALELIHSRQDLELGLLVTGMHLDPLYGYTASEIEASNLPIVSKVPVGLGGNDGANMARAVGYELLGAVDALERFQPHILLLLGDRGEMLAGAIAALHLNIPIAHIHGGELSGTVDEPVRHAISKLSHYHFTATGGARERLIRMGEKPDCIYVTGAPGLDGLQQMEKRSREELAPKYGMDPDSPIALVVFHPVVQEASEAATQAGLLLDALESFPRLQALILMPNADAGGEAIREIFRVPRPGFKRLVHLPRSEFMEWMATVDVMVGNSSSGIIEAASFGTPVINVGERQHGRERNMNVRDVPLDRAAIELSLKECFSMKRGPAQNIYGDGCSSRRIVDLLATVPLNKDLLMKFNAH